MIINNDKYTKTVGEAKASVSNVGGIGETREYTRAEKQRITNDRPETTFQTGIYDQPMTKTILNDIDGSVGRPERERDRNEE